MIAIQPKDDNGDPYDPSRFELIPLTLEDWFRDLHVSLDAQPDIDLPESWRQFFLGGDQ